MPRTVLPRLYHYTCEHSAPDILRDGFLEPHGLPGLPPVVWLTDLDAPVVEALGLTSIMLRCDRTAWRFEVDRALVDPDMIHRWVGVRRQFPPDYVTGLEEADGAMPMHWWLSFDRVPVVTGAHRPACATQRRRRTAEEQVADEAADRWEDDYWKGAAT